jgi:hypothetical protein
MQYQLLRAVESGINSYFNLVFLFQKHTADEIIDLEDMNFLIFKNDVFELTFQGRMALALNSKFFK